MPKCDRKFAKFIMANSLISLENGGSTAEQPPSFEVDIQGPFASGGMWSLVVFLHEKLQDGRQGQAHE